LNNDMTILRDVKALCQAHDFDAAIKRTGEISNKSVAVHAHLLCIEWEQSVRQKEQMRKSA